MRIVAIDWSGDVSNAPKKIWRADFENGLPISVPKNGRGADETAEDLCRLAQKTRDLVVGLDFAFSFPHSYCQEMGWQTGLDVWSAAESDGEYWLRDCPPPFFGRKGSRRTEGRSLFRKTEKSLELRGIHPKSVFQIAGGGQVGTGSIRGMRILKLLKGCGFSVWPFDGSTPPLVVEIYPRLLTGEVNKSDKSTREKYLQSSRFESLGRDWLRVAAESEDSFDAAVSAFEMARSSDDFRVLSLQTDPEVRLEGQIWQPQATNQATWFH